MENEKLAKCPFCKYDGDKYVPLVQGIHYLHLGKNQVVYFFNLPDEKKVNEYVVVCENCGAQGQTAPKAEDAVKRWNECNTD
jgi:transcription elongation factor Elf1